MTKREFYGLFKSAFISAFTEKNITSAWMKAGLLPFAPDIVLAQVRVNQDKENPRPSTRDSQASTASSYSANNMRKVRQLCKKVVGPDPTRDAQTLTDFIQKMATENAILRAEVQGHKMAADVERKRRKRGKPLFLQAELDDNEGKAQFYTPARVNRAVGALTAKVTAKEDEAVRKAQEKLLKKQQKEEQARMVVQRRQARELAAKKKKQELEDTKVQKQAAKQLKNDLKSVADKPKPRYIAPKPKKQVVVVVESDIEYEALVEPRIWTPRPKRAINLPKALQGHDLS